MFRKIRLRFIFIASLAISIILFAFIGVLNTVRQVQNGNEIDSVLSILSTNKGEFPRATQLSQENPGQGLNVAVIDQYQYFSVTMTRDKALVASNITHINHLSLNDIQSLLSKVNSKQAKGSFTEGKHTYAYQLTKTDSAGRYLLVVLDTTRFNNDRAALLKLSIEMCLYILLFFIIMLSLLSSFAIKPFVENYQKQKEFITNAGHELKTPLSIISANNELQELMTGETEWSKSTKDQVGRLTSLINQLVSLARLEERSDLVLQEVNFSEIAQDAAEDFKAPVIKDGKSFSLSIEPNIKVKAEEKSLFELVSILVDNATKYCDAKGQVGVSLKTINTPLRKARLEVSNTYKEGKHQDYSRFFDRFYRQDESHNSRETGYGIGLSMAQSIVSIFKGKISVVYKEDRIIFKVTL